MTLKCIINSAEKMVPTLADSVFAGQLKSEVSRPTLLKQMLNVCDYKEHIHRYLVISFSFRFSLVLILIYFFLKWGWLLDIRYFGFSINFDLFFPVLIQFSLELDISVYLNTVTLDLD